MMSEPDKIAEKLADAQLHPTEPKIVKDGPVHEEIHIGENLLLNEGGK